METIRIPRRDETYIPHLPPLPEHNLTLFGKAISWIRSFEDRGVIARVCMYVSMIFISWILIVSVVGLPLFILGHKEFICQRERSYYDKYVTQLYNAAKDNNRVMALDRALAPLDHINLSLSRSARNRAVKDLGLRKDVATKMTDGDIIRQMAVQFDDYLVRCGIV